MLENFRVELLIILFFCWNIMEIGIVFRFVSDDFFVLSFLGISYVEGGNNVLVIRLILN